MPKNLAELLEQISKNLLPNQELNINYCNPCDIPSNVDEAFKQLAHALRSSTTLKHFIFTNAYPLHPFTLSSVTTRAFGNALKNISSLEQIHIDFGRSSTFNSEQILGFLGCVTGVAKIKQLTLKFYHDDNNVVRKISSILQQNTTLESLDMTGGWSNQPLFDENTVVDFTNALKNKPLKKLTIRGLPLGDSCIALLFANNMLPFQELDLSFCSLTADILPHINTFLRDKKTLTHLHLTKLPLTLASVQQLSIESLQRLQTLELRDCKLEGELLGYLINNLLIHLHSLNKLDLSMNSIDLTSIDFIEQLIEKSHCLKILILNSCKIDDTHLLQLKNTLRNPKLCHLEIFHFYRQEFRIQNIEVLKDILRNNANFIDFTTLYDENIKKILQMNNSKKILRMKNARDQFINAAITLAQGVNDPHNILSILPANLILKILHKAAKNTVGMRDLEIKLRAKLIMQNIRTRKKLIEKREYSPKTDRSIGIFWSQTLKDISSWWSTQSIYKNQQVSLFSKQSPPPIIEEEVEETIYNKHYCGIL